MNLIPDYYFKNIWNVSVKFLVQKNIRGLALDIDNTLAPDNLCELPEKVKKWFDEVKESGISCVAVSNCPEKRAFDFCALCDVRFVASALKPSQRSVPRVLSLLGTAPGETAMIGDQLFTDVFYGKRAGFATILVDPLGKDRLLWVRMKRIFELPWMNKIHERGVTKICGTGLRLDLPGTL